MFADTGVFTEKELQARNEVKWEMFTKKVQIEARVLGDLASNHVIPVATRYQTLLLDNVLKAQAVLTSAKSKKYVKQDIALIEQIAEHVSEIRSAVLDMVNARKVANRVEGEREKAIAYEQTVMPLLDVIRHRIDDLELVVDDEMWPLPKYRELLFIR
jgi:glutamine synthetase